VCRLASSRPAAELCNCAQRHQRQQNSCCYASEPVKQLGQHVSKHSGRQIRQQKCCCLQSDFEMQSQSVWGWSAFSIISSSCWLSFCPSCRRAICRASLRAQLSLTIACLAALLPGWDGLVDAVQTKLPLQQAVELLQTTQKAAVTGTTSSYQVPFSLS